LVSYHCLLCISPWKEKKILIESKLIKATQWSEEEEEEEDQISFVYIK
jgi:hypothetical protein